MPEYNAEAYFTIESSSAVSAKHALAIAYDAVDAALARVSRDLGVAVHLSLEDERGNVEEA